MPVEFTNLGINVFQAQTAQQVMNILNQGENMNAQVNAAVVSDLAKAQASDQVQDPTTVENREIQGDGRGAHSFQFTQEEKKAEEQTPGEPPPPDPTGRGQHLDLTG